MVISFFFSLEQCNSQRLLSLLSIEVEKTIEPLRSENYLLVWLNLIHKKCTTKRNKSFRIIYNECYNRRFTKSERELKKLEIEEANDSDDDEESPKDDEQPMPNLSKKPNSKGTTVNFNTRQEGEALIDGSPNEENKGIWSKIFKRSGSQSPVSETSETSKWSKYVPSALQRNSSEEDAAKKKEKKLQLKAIRQRRKEYLKKQAKIEKRRRLISDAIELLLQCLRLFTTFAILVGNVHKVPQLKSILYWHKINLVLHCIQNYLMLRLE
ncbi:hypothetical protein M3Y96_00458600 [Aphelenchoides besseyi]|nr:hypothetical protein M3Y96_00458600 [Aphelenchoides besseyi]